MINIGWCISDAPKDFFLPNVRNENLVLTILSELSSIYESILVFDRSVEQGETEDLSGKENRENNQSVSYIMHNSLDKKY